MMRNVSSLTDTTFDLVIIGGGIFAACAAWDATLRGLSVALLERNDFASGTSANSFKFIHGGIRYLQHGDVIRLRASSNERRAFLKIAPHLVKPMPVMIPTYGYGKDGKLILGTGACLYDLLTLDRNKGISDRARQIPFTNFLSAEEVRAHFPSINRHKLTGAAIFSDAQMYNPTRLVWAFINSSLKKGAVACNYIEVTGFLRKNNLVHGVTAKDCLTGNELTVQARAVLNAAGPWAEYLLDADDKLPVSRHTYSRDAFFMVKRRFESDHALAISGRTRDPDALLSRSARHLFVVPWRDRSLIGVWHMVWKNSPDSVNVSDDHLEKFIDEINWSYPSLELEPGDITCWNAGLVPFGQNENDAEDLSYGKRSHIIDHRITNGIDGLVTLIGIRYTMGRADAAKAVDIICQMLGHNAQRANTESIAIYGGDIADFESLVNKVSTDIGSDSTKLATAFAHNYGSRYVDLIEMANRENRGLLQPLDNSTVLKIEPVNAVRNEMAINLSDIVFRRTDLATEGDPGNNALSECAQLAARELGWNSTRIKTEIESVRKILDNMV